MISFRDLYVKAAGGQTLIEDATGSFMTGEMNAIIGPSGCGKTTLVKGILGLTPATGGEITLSGQPLRSREELVGIVGFAPQFSIAHRKLKVGECLRYSLDLLVRQREEKEKRFASILRLVGLEGHRENLVENLSGGQLRRLGLAMELTTDPQFLFCDEVTSGLDPQSEEQILALLARLCRDQGKTVACVIHNLLRLNLFRNITVLYRGRLVFQGTLERLLEHFGIVDVHFLYDRLDEEPLEHWLERWTRSVVPEAAAPGTVSETEEMLTTEQQPYRGTPATTGEAATIPAATRSTAAAPAATGSRPDAVTQFVHLFRRRMRLFLRDRGYLALTLGITLGFPLLVVIFAAGGLPQIESMALEYSPNVLETMRSRIEFELEASRTGGLVSGLAMFQVILLTLMGSNNGAREIAGERQVYEKERLSGLRPGAYLGGKAAFVTIIALAQGFWMTVFVKTVCGFPGAWWPQMLILAAATVAMSFISLGFSALFQSPERASLLSVYLVGFQLPLSGVVLALPEAAVWLVRPFITAYWSWAGYLTTMKETRFYDAVVMFSENWMAPTAIAAFVMLIQCLAGLLMAFSGCQKRYWN